MPPLHHAPEWCMWAAQLTCKQKEVHTPRPAHPTRSWSYLVGRSPEPAPGPRRGQCWTPGWQRVQPAPRPQLWPWRDLSYKDNRQGAQDPRKNQLPAPLLGLQGNTPQSIPSLRLPGRTEQFFFEREREREGRRERVLPCTCSCPRHLQLSDWARPKPGTCNSMQVTQMSDRNPAT